jgi:hypothetical protein
MARSQRERETLSIPPFSHTETPECKSRPSLDADGGQCAPAPSSRPAPEESTQTTPSGSITADQGESGGDDINLPCRGLNNKRKKRRKTSAEPSETFTTGREDFKQSIAPLDRSFIEANRMSAEAIRQLARFSSYEAGTPSRVRTIATTLCSPFTYASSCSLFFICLSDRCQTLYIKNLAESTTREDLASIFLSFQKPADERRDSQDFLEFRLMQVRSLWCACVRACVVSVGMSCVC